MARRELTGSLLLSLPALTGVPTSGDLQQGTPHLTPQPRSLDRELLQADSEGSHGQLQPLPLLQQNLRLQPGHQEPARAPLPRGDRTGAPARHHSQGARVMDALAPEGPLVLFLHTGSVSKGQESRFAEESSLFQPAHRASSGQG